MEEHPHLPHRQENFGGEDEDEQGGAQVHSASGNPETDGNGHQGYRKGRQQLKYERGQEADAQGAHRFGAVGRLGAAQPLELSAGSSEDLQGRQPSDQISEVVGQSGGYLEPFCYGRLGPPANEGHENGDERDRHDDDDEAGEVV